MLRNGCAWDEFWRMSLMVSQEEYEPYSRWKE